MESALSMSQKVRKGRINRKRILINISFVDLASQHQETHDEIDAAIKAILDKSSFIAGSYVKNFESGLAVYCGRKFAVTCAN